MQKQSVNLLVVDWREPGLLLYTQTVALIPRIAEKIVEILDKFLKATNTTPEKLHVIAHSLGCHVAAAVGRYYNGTIDRLTALDPAGPLYFNNPPGRISKEDAKFVDVIHTAANTLGIFDPM